MKAKILVLLAVGMLGLPVGANATQITGSISLTGFFDCNCFAPGDTSIVSLLLQIVGLDPAVAGAGFGDYAGSGGFVTPVETILLDPLDPGYPGVQPVYTFADGTEFFAKMVKGIIRRGMTCENGSCLDSLEFVLTGTVTRPGFDATPAVVNWTGQGSCLGVNGVCGSQPTASWSASMSSPARVPEPGTLALLGLGLAGLGLSRRRKTN